jgi:hypothetical protein
LTKRLVERALAVELTEHMGQERYESVANATANTCNGKNKKTAHLFHGSTVLNLAVTGLTYADLPKFSGKVFLIYKKECRLKIAALISFVFGSFLAGCASTGVIPVDRDSYMIGKKDGTPGLGVSLSNKAEVYREANAFCKQRGLEVQTLNLSVTPAAPARLGSTELHFKCVNPGGTAQPLIRESDQIIEIRNR